MTQNRFEQVDEPQPDALTLAFAQEGEKNYATITCPASAAPGRLPKDFSSGELPIKEALRSAVRLANDFKVPIVVVDPQNLWDKDWGRLYRYEDEPDEADPVPPPAAA